MNSEYDNYEPLSNVNWGRVMKSFLLSLIGVFLYLQSCCNELDPFGFNE